MIEERKISPFDSFKEVYKVLVWTGYCKLLKTPNDRFKRIGHQIYRVMGLIMAVVFNIHHLMFIAQNLDRTDDIFECLMIEIPQMNLLVKHLTLNLQTSRIDKINTLIQDPVFGAYTKNDEELLLKNKKEMDRLCKIAIISINLTGIFWPATHFVRRYQDPKAVVPYYVPFDTQTWSRYSMSVACLVVPLLWVGYGHLALDCLMSAYYAQAEVQLKIIKYKLEHLFDKEVDASDQTYRYKDAVYPDLKKYFVCYLQRFDKLAWYTKEVTETFSPAMLFQFFTSSLTMCMVSYRLSNWSIPLNVHDAYIQLLVIDIERKKSVVCKVGLLTIVERDNVMSDCAALSLVLHYGTPQSKTPVGSIPFLFTMLVLIIISAQVFLYCYFGSLVQYESESVVYSMYLSDWMSVSPKFRRMLLIAMLRWSRSLSPKMSGLIPLSLDSFVSIVKSAYSLYAILGTRQ